MGKKFPYKPLREEEVEVGCQQYRQKIYEMQLKFNLKPEYIKDEYGRFIKNKN